MKIKDDNKILEENDRFMRKLYKSIFFTFITVLFTMYGLIFISSLIFGEGDFALIISFFISIIFIIIYCTITIIEEIKKDTVKLKNK